MRPSALVLLFGVVTYAILGTLTASALILGSNAVDQQVDLRMASAASGSAAYVDQRLEARSGLLLFVAGRPSLVAALGGGHLDPAGSSTVSSTLVQLLGGTEGGYTAFVAWPNGTLAASTAAGLAGQDFSGRDWYRGALRTNGPYISSAFQGASVPHPLVVAVSTRIFDATGRLLGVLGVSFQLSKLPQFVDSFAAAQGIRLLVTDQSGTVIAHTGQTVTSLGKTADPSVAAALAGRAGNDDSSSKQLAAYAPAPFSHWAIVAEVPRDVAFSGLALMQRSVLLAASVLGLVNLGMVAVLNGATRRRASAEVALSLANTQLAKRLADASMLASIVDSSEDAIIGKTLEGTVTSWNRAAETMYGYSPGEIIGKPVSVLIPESKQLEMRAMLDSVGGGKGVKHYETERIRKDGAVLPVSLSVSPIRDESGSVVGVASIARDITERLQAEREIRRAADYARSLLETSLDPLVTISRDGKITDVNEATVKVTGVERASLIGTDFSSYFTDPERAHTGYQRAFRQGSVLDYELTIRGRNGHLTPVLYNASVFRDASGKVIGVFAAARDITEQRRAAQYARNLIEASLDPLVTISREGKITDVNEATVKVTGIDRSALIGTDFSEYFTEPDLARAGYERVFADGSVTDYPLTLRSKDGHLTPVLYNATVYRDPSGEVAGVFAAARDVTEQRRAQLEISALNRLLEQRVKDRTRELEVSNQELEAFTYSVSHDLRAPLRAMAGFSNLLTERESARLDADGKQYVERINVNALKMGTLIDELLKFSRLGRASMNVEQVDPAAIARSAFSDLSEQAGSAGVEVVIGPLPTCSADAGLLKQVYANLLSNAIKFSRGREGARVEVGSHEENGQAVYDVRDNGVGFDMRYADKLFGVFQRLHSQAEYEGTGVGLALVQRIVHRHGGRIWAEAEVGKGATFHFTLKGD